MDSLLHEFPEILCRPDSSAARNLMVDEQLLRRAAAARAPSLHVWWGGAPTVVLGLSNKVEQAVNQRECERLGIDVVRRFTGGGAVLQAEGVFNYSLAIPSRGLVDPRKVFAVGAALIMAILRTFDLIGYSDGDSDVAIDGRKISGNSQAQRRGALLVHGTLLVDLDYQLLDQVLPHPVREPSYRKGRRHGDFLVSLNDLGKRMARPEIEQRAVRAAQLLFRSVA